MTGTREVNGIFDEVWRGTRRFSKIEIPTIDIVKIKVANTAAEYSAPGKMFLFFFSFLNIRAMTSDIVEIVQLRDSI